MYKERSCKYLMAFLDLFVIRYKNIIILSLSCLNYMDFGFPKLILYRFSYISLNHLNFISPWKRTKINVNIQVHFFDCLDRKKGCLTLFWFAPLLVQQFKSDKLSYNCHRLKYALARTLELVTYLIDANYYR